MARMRVFGGQFGPDDYMITAAWVSGQRHVDQRARTDLSKLLALGLTIVLLMRKFVYQAQPYQC